jgi:hypothetical protein
MGHVAALVKPMRLKGATCEYVLPIFMDPMSIVVLPLFMDPIKTAVLPLFMDPMKTYFCLSSWTP